MSSGCAGHRRAQLLTPTTCVRYQLEPCPLGDSFRFPCKTRGWTEQLGGDLLSVKLVPYAVSLIIKPKRKPQSETRELTQRFLAVPNPMPIQQMYMELLSCSQQPKPGQCKESLGWLRTRNQIGWKWGNHLYNLSPSRSSPEESMGKT